MGLTSCTGGGFSHGHDNACGSAGLPESQVSPEKLVNESTIHTPTFFLQRVCNEKEMILSFLGNEESEVLLYLII